MRDELVYSRTCATKLRVKMLPALIAALLTVAGCGGGSGGGPSGGSPSAARGRLHGVMHGGQNPVAGATVTLYEAGFNGYGISNAVLATTTTDSNGKYSIASFTCSIPGERSNPISPDIVGDSSLQTYIVATGGDAGSGPNSAIGLMAAIGACDQIQNSTVVNINELTTIAAEWSLQQFADSSGQMVGAPSQNMGGLTNAYNTNYNLAETNSADLSVSGNPSSFLPSAAQCGAGSPPVNCDGLERLDTLADIIAACVNSSGPSSTACKTLFCDATPGLTFSGTCSGTPTITDTLQASHSIAQNPANNVGSLFALATPNAPSSPPSLRGPMDGKSGLTTPPRARFFRVRSRSRWTARATSLWRILMATA
jgi:hypothetical protein